MRFDFIQRRILVSPGEIATFRTDGTTAVPGGTGSWRAETGREWHETLRTRTAERHPDATFEVPIRGALVHGGWTFAIQGRIDQLVPSPGGVLVREVKTVTATLPLSGDAIVDDFPGHCMQAACYARILRALPEYRDHAIACELALVDISTGMLQLAPLDDAWESLLDRALDSLAQFATQRLQAGMRLARLADPRPYAAWREGQEQALATLDEAFAAHPVFLEAPTGFGKTGVVLAHALRGLRDGRWTRVLWLTGKTSGQWGVAELLASGYADPETAPHWVVLRSRNTLCNPAPRCCQGSTAACARTRRWSDPATGKALQHLAGQVPPPDIATVRAAAERIDCCPYALALGLLPHADIWIGDFNYLFAPSSAPVLANQPAYDPAQTLLVVDEAHNLPRRAAEARSLLLRADDAWRVDAALARLDHPRRLLRAWELWTELLASLPQRDCWEPEAEADISEALLRFQNELLHNHLEWQELADEEVAAIDAALRLPDALARPDLPRLLWSPAPGMLRLDCLDAAAAIGAAVAPFAHTVFMSATLEPMDDFATACGIEPAAYSVVRAPAPWRDPAYDVAVDIRADTRYARRDQTLGHTASVLATAATTLDGPVVAFFPSYRYAERVIEVLASGPNPPRTALQPKGAMPETLGPWLDAAIASRAIVFLVLGGSMAEGVDTLGGRTALAVIVGPALPEVGPVTETRRALDEVRLGRDEAFRRAYLIPGMRRVNQAIGRLVRNPGQRARVLLHCHRFADSRFSSLLAPEYRNARILRSDTEYQDWLQPS